MYALYIIMFGPCTAPLVHSQLPAHAHHLSRHIGEGISHQKLRTSRGAIWYGTGSTKYKVLSLMTATQKKLGTLASIILGEIGVFKQKELCRKNRLTFQIMREK